MADAPRFKAPPGFRLAVVEELRPLDDCPVRITHSDPGWAVSFEPGKPLVLGWYRLRLRFPPQGIVEAVAQVSFARGEQIWLRVPAADRNSFVAFLRVAHPLERITLRLAGSGYPTRLEEFSLQRLDPFSTVASIANRAWQVAQRSGFGVFGSAFNFAVRLTRPEMIAVAPASGGVKGETPYDTWSRLFDEAPEQHRERHEERLATLTHLPLISCLAVVTLSDRAWLERLARGLAGQVYRRWEILVAASDENIAEIAQVFAAGGVDPHTLRVVAARTNPIDMQNELAKEADGDFVLPIAQGAVLRPHALLEFALALERHPDAEIIYSDEDIVDADGSRHDPKFKPAWAPDYFAAHDYIGQPALLRRLTLLAAGGWRAERAGAHDHDLRLRIADRVEPRTILHIAKVLAHRSQVGTPAVNPQAVQLQTVKAMNDRIVRCQLDAEVLIDDRLKEPRLRYRVPQPAPLVSLIIPTRDRAALLETCIRSITARTQYESYEIIIIDNDSMEEQTHRLFASLRAHPAIRILPSPGPFNFSALNNQAAGEARGQILSLINNDIEAIDGGWLADMVGLAARPEIGCVGAKLLYPDGRIQHAGVFLGIGGIAAHAHRFLPRDAPGYMDRLRSVQNVSAVTAACLVVRKEIYDEVGGLDEGALKVAFNDVDFCLKVREAGYRNVWTPFAELIHHESISRGRDNTRAKANRFASEFNVLRQRWGGRLLSDPYYSPNLTLDLEDFSVRVR